MVKTDPVPRISARWWELAESRARHQLIQFVPAKAASEVPPLSSERSLGEFSVKVDVIWVAFCQLPVVWDALDFNLMVFNLYRSGTQGVFEGGQLSYRLTWFK